MFNKISYRTLNIVKYSAVAVLFAVGSALIIYLFSKQMTEIAQGIRTYNNISAQRQERIAFSSQLSKDIEKIGAGNEAKLQNALIIDEDISDIVQIINALAGKYSTTHSFPSISGISSNPTSSGANKLTVLSVDYSFQMRTSVGSFVSYLKELEANKNFIATTSFNIASDEKTGWSAAGDVSVTGKIYYKGQ